MPGPRRDRLAGKRLAIRARLLTHSGVFIWAGLVVLVWDCLGLWGACLGQGEDACYHGKCVDGGS